MTLARRLLRGAWPLLAAACHSSAPPPTPAVPVNIALVRRSDVPLLLEASGTVEPISTVAVQAQVSGLLLHVAFQEGQEVHKGQVLFELDARPYQATLDQARANLARDAAQWQNAQRDAQRFEELAKQQYVTQEQLDQARATRGALAATLSGDSAAVEQAQLNLQYATIRAPITGRAGALLVRQGNLVRSNSGEPLVVINQIHPVLVRFPVPAGSFDAVRRDAGTRGLSVVAAPIADSAQSEHGTLVFLDNAVDSLTGTVTLKASFPNSMGALWPGALVRVSLQLEVEKSALVVPLAAVQGGQSGSIVWIVDSASKARSRKVQVLRSADSLAVLAGGVAAGERAVTDGQLRLTEGARVTIRGGGHSGANGGKAQ